MRNKLLIHLSVLFILLQSNIEAHSQSVLFNKIYPKPNGVNLEAVAAYQLESGNYFVIARHDNGSYFARMDPMGNKIWESFNYDGKTPHYSIKRKNGNYLVSGDSLNEIYPNKPYLREIDTSGNEIWTSSINLSYESVNWMGSSKIIELADQSLRMIMPNEFPVWGDYQFYSGSESYYLKLDSIGNLMDTTVLIGSYIDLIEAIDSGFILIGAIPYIKNIIQPNDTLWGYKLAVTQLGNNGDSVWSKQYGYPHYLFGSDWAGCDIIKLDSTYLILGNTDPPFEAGTTPGFVDHFDMNGNPTGNLGQLNFPVVGETSSFIKRTFDKGILIGRSRSYCDPPGDCWYAGAYSYFIKYDSLFNKEWSDSGSVSWYGTKSVTEANEGGFIAVGNTSQFNYLPPWDFGRLNLWNYDSLGNSISNLNEEFFANAQISIFPNPASDQLIFNFSDSRLYDLEISVYTLQGNVVKNRILGENKTSINVFDLESGVYIFKIQSEEFNSVGKFIKK